VRFLTLEATILSAVVGMLPLGTIDLNPAANAIHTLLAVFQADQWRIALLQNTPAQYHGRPELAKALTAELRAFLKAVPTSYVSTQPPAALNHGKFPIFLKHDHMHLFERVDCICNPLLEGVNLLNRGRPAPMHPN
jgi:hypothetical protein